MLTALFVVRNTLTSMIPHWISHSYIAVYAPEQHKSPIAAQLWGQNHCDYAACHL